MRLRRNRTPPPGDGAGPYHFGVRTCLARAAGKDGRYKLSTVRALPTSKPDTVVLQATDGQQAVCLIAPGSMGSARLVPTEVFPKRQGAKGATVDLGDGHWRSSDGKTAPDVHRDESVYPPIMDVLPKFGERDKAPPVQLGIDLTVLNKVSDALGTSKLTLFIPHASKTPPPAPGSPGDPSTADGGFIKKPIAVCPATDEGKVRGIGVLVPLQPVNGVGFYMKVRRLVADAESRCKPKAVRAARVRPKRQPQPV